MIDNIFVPLPIRKRAEQLGEILQEITGYDPFEKSRKRMAVLSRMIVAYQLRQEGVLLSDIGRIFDKDHSTIHFYQDRMKMAVNTPGYDVERKIWEAFRKRIQ